MALLSALFPGFCLLCRRRSGRTDDICAACEAALASNPEPCPLCALPRLGPPVCAGCLVAPPAWDLALAPFLYAPPITRLVLGLKHGNGRQQARLLATLSAPPIARAYAGLPRPDLLVPVPLARWRRRHRGFNQAALLCRELSRRLDVALADDALRRIRETPAQRGLSRSARLRNLRGAFTATRDLAGTVAIVDDVLTTGATLTGCALALRKAGAVEVHVWTVARTADSSAVPAFPDAS